MKTASPFVTSLFLLTAASAAANAQNADALAEMARKAQDPLGNVQALMTDNTIAFDGGPDDDTSYGFQLQPVYAIQNDSNWNMIARGIIPIMGFEPGVVIPPIGPDPRPTSGSDWGIGDSFSSSSLRRSRLPHGSGVSDHRSR